MGLIDTLCRVCAKSSDVLVQAIGEEGYMSNLEKKIRLCLPMIIVTDKELPKQVCPACLKKLDVSYQLYMGCVSAQATLKKIASNCQNRSPVFTLDPCTSGAKSTASRSMLSIQSTHWGYLAEDDEPAPPHVYAQDLGTVDANQGICAVAPLVHKQEVETMGTPVDPCTSGAKSTASRSMLSFQSTHWGYLAEDDEPAPPHVYAQDLGTVDANQGICAVAPLVHKQEVETMGTPVDPCTSGAKSTASRSMLSIQSTHWGYLAEDDEPAPPHVYAQDLGTVDANQGICAVAPLVHKQEVETMGTPVDPCTSGAKSTASRSMLSIQSTHWGYLAEDDEPAPPHVYAQDLGTVDANQGICAVAPLVHKQEVETMGTPVDPCTSGAKSTASRSMLSIQSTHWGYLAEDDEPAPPHVYAQDLGTVDANQGICAVAPLVHKQEVETMGTTVDPCTSGAKSTASRSMLSIQSTHWGYLAEDDEPAPPHVYAQDLGTVDANQGICAVAPLVHKQEVETMGTTVDPCTSGAKSTASRSMLSIQSTHWGYLAEDDEPAPPHVYAQDLGTVDANQGICAVAPLVHKQEVETMGTPVDPCTSGAKSTASRSMLSIQSTHWGYLAEDDEPAPPHVYAQDLGTVDANQGICAVAPLVHKQEVETMGTPVDPCTSGAKSTASRSMLSIQSTHWGYLAEDDEPAPPHVYAQDLGTVDANQGICAVAPLVHKQEVETMGTPVDPCTSGAKSTASRSMLSIQRTHWGYLAEDDEPAPPHVYAQDLGTVDANQGICAVAPLVHKQEVETMGTPVDPCTSGAKSTASRSMLSIQSTHWGYLAEDDEPAPPHVYAQDLGTVDANQGICAVAPLVHKQEVETMGTPVDPCTSGAKSTASRSMLSIQSTHWGYLAEDDEPAPPHVYAQDLGTVDANQGICAVAPLVHKQEVETMGTPVDPCTSGAKSTASRSMLSIQSTHWGYLAEDDEPAPPHVYAQDLGTVDANQGICAVAPLVHKQEVETMGTTVDPCTSGAKSTASRSMLSIQSTHWGYLAEDDEPAPPHVYAQDLGTVDANQGICAVAPLVHKQEVETMGTPVDPCTIGAMTTASRSQLSIPSTHYVPLSDSLSEDDEPTPPKKPCVDDHQLSNTSDQGNKPVHDPCSRSCEECLCPRLGHCGCKPGDLCSCTFGARTGSGNDGHSSGVPLLPNPSATISPPPGEVTPHPPFPNPALEDASGAGVMGMPHMASQVPVQDQTNFWNGLLGQLQDQQPPQPLLNLPPLDPNLMAKGIYFDHGLGGPKSPLHGDKANATHFSQQVASSTGKIPHPHSLKQHGAMLNFPDAVSGDLQQTINTILSNAQNLNQLLGSLTNAIQTNGNGSNIPTPRQVISGALGFSFMGQPGTLLPNVQAPPPPQESTWTMSVAPSLTARPQPVITMTTAQNGQPIMGSPVPSGRPILTTPVAAGRPILGSPVPVPVPAPKLMSFLEVKPGQLRQSPFQNTWAPNPGTFLASPSNSPQFGTFANSGFMTGLWSHPGSPILIASPPSGLVTPIGQKRKYNRLLPSPEPSPEANYIGQHSQCLGGHYADSYFKRKKKN